LGNQSVIEIFWSNQSDPNTEKGGSRFCFFQNEKTRRNHAFSILTAIFSNCCPRECPCRETSPGHGRNPARMSVCHKVIVKNRKSNASNFLQLLFILQSSSSKCMSTLMLTGRQRNFQDVLFLVCTRALVEVLSHTCEHVCSCNCCWTSHSSAPGKWVPSSVWKTSTRCFPAPETPSPVLQLSEDMG
jgi:hypothetical protein